MENINKCIYCDSENIKKELTIGSTHDVGSIGLEYKYKSKGILVSNYSKYEQIFADLCMNCGSVVRFYIKNLDRNWTKEKK